MTFIKVISLHFETYLRYLNILMDQGLITPIQNSGTILLELSEEV